ncbi:hypothetical protein BB559_006911 [Furculomyces boomerangus]|uniref:Reverse transcriptase domain-containing protein n=1 Tax=Furculomyces boomerangus TaxID=61424 RepID=A0A2T9XZX0_9FUNG|nr:hypothetical protein BB559_006911 [Furculomyces boomerangus]
MKWGFTKTRTKNKLSSKTKKKAKSFAFKRISTILNRRNRNNKNSIKIPRDWGNTGRKKYGQKISITDIWGKRENKDKTDPRPNTHKSVYSKRKFQNGGDSVTTVFNITPKPHNKSESKISLYAHTLHKDSKNLCKFIHKNRIYEFQSIPFGLKTAPRIFSKIIKAVLEPLRINRVV